MMSKPPLQFEMVPEIVVTGNEIPRTGSELISPRHHDVDHGYTNGYLSTGEGPVVDSYDNDMIENADCANDGKSRFSVHRVQSIRRDGAKTKKPIELIASSLLNKHKRNTITFGDTTYMYNRNNRGSIGSENSLGQLSPRHDTYHSYYLGSLGTYHSGQFSPHATYQSHLSPHATYAGQFSPNGTANCKTFGRGDTQEALPHMDHYRNLMSAITAMKQRPTLYELHEDQIEVPHQHSLIPAEDQGENKDKNANSAPSTQTGPKFGWIQGVLVRCLLNIFGVMLFLRLSWVTGQAGIGWASVIILLSAVVTVVTTCSMSAICTNGEVKGGGAYYMISRSLGPEFGGAIGIVFSLANAVAAAMYVVGFAETVVQLLDEYKVSITGNPLNDIRLIGVVTSILLLGIVVIGMEWEAKAQLVLLVILVVAIVNFMVGTVLPPTEEKREKGFIGYSGELFVENFGPDFRGEEGFFSVFSVFFPAATGILAGANISGDLKDPQKAIPKGTFLAIIITTIIYLAMAWMCGSVLERDAFGPIIAPFVGDLNVTSLINQSITLSSTMTEAGNVSCCVIGSDISCCEYGSINYNYSVGLASGYRPLILAGIFAATLSSALASLISAPKVFQAVCKDRLFPGTVFFAKGYGKSGEPIRGYILTFVIAIGITCIAELNVIAPIISNFFLMAYTLINFSCFDASLAKSPGFRPAFKFYNKWLSLLGSLLCLAVMFVINYQAAVVTFVVVGALYLYIRYRKPEVNWGSSSQAHAYQDALNTCLKLTNVEEHVKNFRPQILVLSGNPENRPDLVDFASAITKKQSLLVCGHILQGDMTEHLKHLRSMTTYGWFKDKKIKAFYCGVAAASLRQGAQVLLQTIGLGKMRPNTLILGYKSNWQTDDEENVDQYFNIIHDAFDLQYGVGVFRVPNGLDIHKVTDEVLVTEDSLEHGEFCADFDEDEEIEHSSSNGSSPSVPAILKESETNGADHIPQIQGLDNPLFGEASHISENIAYLNGDISAKKHRKIEKVQSGISLVSMEEDGCATSVSVMAIGDDGVNPKPGSRVEHKFRMKQSGTIDVWWLFDDGGLTLLVPYILSTRASWKGCKLRVFCVGTKQANINEDQRRMATLLHKFRIDYSQLTVIPDLRSKPSLESTREFESTVEKWKTNPDDSVTDYPWRISEAELLAQKPKTNRHLKLRELLLKHSKDASLIVMTLPVPKKATTSAGLYMAWLEMLTKDMPPILLLRGNQQNVLTFYS